MISHVLLTVIITFFSVFPAFAIDWPANLRDHFRGPITEVPVCAEALRRRAIEPAREDMTRLTQEYPAWARLDSIISQMSEKNLNLLFGMVNFQTLSQLKAAAFSGNLDLKHPEDMKLLVEFSDFVLKNHELFWARPNQKKPRMTSHNGQGGDRAAEDEDSDESEGEDSQKALIKKRNVLAALERFKIEQSQKYLSTGLFGIHPNQTIQALRATEEHLVKKVKGEGTDLPGTKVGRYFSPMYKKVERILQVVTYILREAEAIKDVDNIILNYLEYNQGKLDSNTERELRKTLDDTPMQLASLQMLVARIFGEDVVKGKPIDIEAIDLARLNRNVKDSNFESIENGSWSVAVEDIDRLANEMDRQNQSSDSGFSYKDMKDRGLQVRWMIRKWNRVDKREKYLMAIDKSPGGEVWYKTRHTRLVCTTINKKTHCRTETYYLTRYPSYEDILNDTYSSHGGSISTPERVQWIREQSMAMRNIENKFREAVVQSEKFLKSNSESMSKQGSRKNLDEVANQIKKLKALLPDLQGYKVLSHQQIIEQWQSDIPGEFRERNQLLYVRMLNNYRALKILEESLRRNFSELNPEYNIPDRSLLLSDLRSTYLWARGTQVVMGVTFTAMGVYGAMNPDVYDYTKAHVQYEWSRIEYLMGLDHRPPDPPPWSWSDWKASYSYDPMWGSYRYRQNSDW